MTGNLFGGITAAVIALPLALAFGISSGLGPLAGLYGAAIVGIFAAIFGGTASQISGPTGPMTVVMTGIITQFLTHHPDNGLALAFTAVMLAGCLQMVMGALKLGKYIIMVPYPVISGFMSGIGVIIILLQLAPLLGHTASGNVPMALLALPAQLTDISFPNAIMGFITLGILAFWPSRWQRILPGAIVAMLVVSIAAFHTLPSHSYPVIGHIPSGLPEWHWPELQLTAVKDVLLGAIMLALLGAIDSLLTSLVADNVTGQEHDSDRELIGQGLGNIVAGMIGGLPGAGATMRTIVNIRAGGSTPLSGVVHSLIILAIALGFGFVFSHIPIAVLAGILLKVGVDIIDWPFIRRLHKMPRFPVALMLLVLFLTVWVDLITAVFVGVFIKNMVIIDKLSEMQLGSVILTDGSNEAVAISEAEREELMFYNGGALLLKISGPMCYGTDRSLKKLMKQYPGKHALLIDVSTAALIGLSTALMIEDIVKRAKQKGMQVIFIGMSQQAEAELRMLGVIDSP
ncbi:MAG TPA: SulP family inorganic anion transporter [Pseudomonadales bacterium]|nr:SulP family inorganic anion transporter [Pseudomonadales bacterium]